MLTWRLWRALRNPDEGDPIYERVREQPIDLPGRRLLRPFARLSGVIGVLLPAVIVIIAPVALLIGANLFGALIAFNVMSTLNRERERKTYDLLALTPPGRGAVNWRIAAACVYRVDAIERLAQLRTLAVTILVLLLFYSFQRTIVSPITVLGLLLAVNLDAIQTLIVGCLSGMLAQRFGEQGAPYAALAIFIFAQIILVYLPVTGVAILVIDLVLPLPLEHWQMELIFTGCGLALLFLLREVLLRLMWRELEQRLL